MLKKLILNRHLESSERNSANPGSSSAPDAAVDGQTTAVVDAALTTAEVSTTAAAATTAAAPLMAAAGSSDEQLEDNVFAHSESAEEVSVAASAGRKNLIILRPERSEFLLYQFQR